MFFDLLTENQFGVFRTECSFVFSHIEESLLFLQSGHLLRIDLALLIKPFKDTIDASLGNHKVLVEDFWVVEVEL